MESFGGEEGGGASRDLPDWRQTDAEAAAVFWDLVASRKEVCKGGRTSKGGMASLPYYGIIAALSSTVAAFLQFRAILMGYVLAEELENILWPHPQKS